MKKNRIKHFLGTGILVFSGGALAEIFNTENYLWLFFVGFMMIVGFYLTDFEEKIEEKNL